MMKMDLPDDDFINWSLDPRIADVSVEYSEDGTGRTVYRYVIVSEWEVFPSV